MRRALQLHSRGRSTLRYPILFSERIYAFFIIPLLFLGLLIFVGDRLFDISFAVPPINAHIVILAVLATLARLLIAYIFALVISLPLALLATATPLTKKIFLPLFDIFESIPVLAFFPILVVFFVKFGLRDEAAMFVIFLGMIWNIVFTAIGGITLIPKDIKDVATIFHLTRFRYFFKVLLPSIFPELVTGSILAFAEGWNIIIVAEVLHVYIKGGTPDQDLFGVGSLLVRAISEGQNGVFAIVLAAMVFVIALFNFFVWQKLLRVSDRFKFE